VSKLREILDWKRGEVAAAKSRVSESELRSRISGEPRGFREALLGSGHPVSLIAEVKRASPSQGVIRHDFDPVELAKTYVETGADCLSILTDSKFFGGSPEILQRVRGVVMVPILRKDFTIDAYQILEARAWGADAILLIVAALSESELREFQAFAWDLGLDVLVEVHTDSEMEVALSMGANLIGVNNRNLADFTIDVGFSERLLPQLPASVLGVSESALESFEEIERVQRAGARSVLIGTTFARSADVAGTMRFVMGW
jgi:indole-3-glycerol phosphate synthase